MGKGAALVLRTNYLSTLLRTAAVSRGPSSIIRRYVIVPSDARACAGPTEYLDEGRSAHTLHNGRLCAGPSSRCDRIGGTGRWTATRTEDMRNECHRRALPRPPARPGATGARRTKAVVCSVPGEWGERAGERTAESARSGARDRPSGARDSVSALLSSRNSCRELEPTSSVEWLRHRPSDLIQCR
jgi:hypothetical protein